MKKQIQQAVCALMSIMVASSVGCSSGFRSGNNGGTTPANGAASTGSSAGEDQLAKAQAAVTAGQTAMQSATTAISSITTSNGSIDLSLFQNVLTGGSVLAPIIAKLQPVFDEAYNKVLMVKQQFDASKAAIAAQVAKLDPADPTAVLLTKELTELTDLETKFDDQVHALANRLTLVNTQLDGLVSQLAAAIPNGLGVFAGLLINAFIVDDVKALITQLQTKLLAL